MTPSGADNASSTMGSMREVGTPVSRRSSLHHNEEDQLTIDKVSRLMREQDADLLESMHYAASEVSQYSPEGSPRLRPKDRSLPLEDASMRRVSSMEQLVMLEKNPSFGHARTPTTSETRTDTGISNPPEEHQTRHNSIRSRTNTSEEVAIVLWQGEAKLWEQRDVSENSGQTAEPTSDSRFRRLLSGEVRALEQAETKKMQTTERITEDGEEETTASPVSVAQEAAATAIERTRKQESGLAEQRRVREAMQFAEAVGEKIGINQEELCIIEDNTVAGDSDVDDDDDACESKEIIVGDLDSVQGAMTSSRSVPPDASIISASGAASSSEDQLERVVALPSHVDVHSRPGVVRVRSKRPLWPFGQAETDYDRFLDHLSDGLDQTSFVYKGICANPPEITKRGIQRGNYAQLHRKAWLEVSDKYHRYGKNLRLYYRLWERLGFPTNQFFDWLDSKGEAAGQPLPNLDECPRSVLDSDTVLYISNPEVTDRYALDIEYGEEGYARIVDVDGCPVVTRPEGWIFVLRDSVMYGAEKITSITGLSKQRFHHSSFFGGKAVSAAGIIITDEEGYLTRLYPHSGHYRPGEAHMQRMLFFLHSKGIDLRTFEMDIQQFRHVSREKDAGKPKDKNGDKKKCKEKDGERKMKKVDSLHLEKAVNVACFLAHKAGFIGNGIFDKIHKIRKADVTSVSEALDLVDDGGFWPRSNMENDNYSAGSLTDEEN